MKVLSALGLYRRLLRDAHHFPVAPIKRKLLYNVREMYDLHKQETDLAEIERLIGDGEAALRVLSWMKSLPEVCLFKSLVRVDIHAGIQPCFIAHHFLQFLLPACRKTFHLYLKTSCMIRESERQRTARK